MDPSRSVASDQRVAHCRHCGGRTSTRIPPNDTVPREVCDHCGSVHYENPKMLVAGLLYEGDCLLWIRRATPPYQGRWALPAGFMECGETVSETACRELYEETRLRLEPAQMGLYSILSVPGIDQVHISLIGRLPSHDYGPTDEALEVRLLNRDHVQQLDLAYPPATLPLILQVYDNLERGRIGVAPGLILEVRGVATGLASG